jgi:hypothetical protein
LFHSQWSPEEFPPRGTLFYEGVAEIEQCARFELDAPTRQRNRVTGMDTPKYTIKDDYDPADEKLTASSSPAAAYLTYVDEKIAGAVGKCKFTLEDFERHISELQERKVKTPK